ncbi:MAG: hypothetical protein JO109_17185, partial [Alphaproteobacteria bacterium]|nr:hypothetical protein [Alphaproteobacteria bacterium]
CGATAVSISLTGEGRRGTATLAMESDSLKADVACPQELSDRFERIVTGLSRQLRTAIGRDRDTGRYSLDIAIVEKGEI